MAAARDGIEARGILDREQDFYDSRVFTLLRFFRFGLKKIPLNP